jgi:excisionase family DNA binding protein
MNEPITAGWITTAEAAELTGYSAPYMRQLVKKGRIKGRKVSRDWLLNRESLLRYKARMDALGTAKHNPWREDLDAQGRGRRDKAT